MTLCRGVLEQYCTPRLILYFSFNSNSSFLQKTLEKLKVRKIETLLFGGLVKIILFGLEDILYGYLKNYLKKTP